MRSRSPIHVQATAPGTETRWSRWAAPGRRKAVENSLRDSDLQQSRSEEPLRSASASSGPSQTATLDAFSETPPALARRHWLQMLLLVCTAFAARALIIVEFPVVFHFDAFARLWDPHDLFVRHWLPIPQLPIVLTSLMDGTITAVRFAYAGVGSLAVGAVAWALGRAGQPTAGIVAGWLIAFYPPFLTATVVPYQEGFLLLFAALALGGIAVSAQSNPLAFRVLAAVSLALACLSRYEGWLLTLILLASALLRRNWVSARVTMPAIVTMVAWACLLPTLSLADGPPRAAVSPIVVNLFEGSLIDLARQVGAALATLSLAVARALDPTVVLLVGIGIVSAFRRSLMSFRLEVLLLATALFGLSAVRMVNAGFMSSRMVLAPSMWLILFAGLGLIGATGLLRRPMATLARTVVVGFLVLIFGLQSVGDVRESSRQYLVDHEASLVLLSLPSEVSVGIIPRPSTDILGQSMVAAIMGQSLALDPADPRWSFQGRVTPSHRPELLLQWTRGGYALQHLSEGEPGSPLRVPENSPGRVEHGS